MKAPSRRVLGRSVLSWSLLSGSVLGLGACGSPNRSGPSAAELLTQAPPPEGTEGDAARASSIGGVVYDAVLALRHNPCAVRRAIALRPQLFGSAEERELAQLDRFAHALCDAGVEGVRSDWGPDGRVELRAERGQVIERGRSVFLFEGFEAWSTSGRSDFGTETLPACGGRASATPWQIYPAEGVEATLRLEGAATAFLWMRTPEGDDTCVSFDEGTRALSLSGAGPTEVRIGAGKEDLSWELVVESVAAGNTYGRTWIFGEFFEQEVVLGPFDRPVGDTAGAYCPGYIGETPTISVRVPRAGAGSILVEGTGDPVLVVRGPDDEIYCNDDYIGLDPGVDAWFEAGDWDIWVGTYSPGREISARIRFE